MMTFYSLIKIIIFVSAFILFIAYFLAELDIYYDIDRFIEEKQRKIFLKKYKAGFVFQAISYAYKKGLYIYDIPEIKKFKKDDCEELLTNLILFLNLKKLPKSCLNYCNPNCKILENIKKLFEKSCDYFYCDFTEFDELKTEDIPSTTDKEEIKAFLHGSQKKRELKAIERKLAESLKREKAENILFLRRNNNI